jgi:PAS domain S-box-containing protein
MEDPISNESEKRRLKALKKYNILNIQDEKPFDYVIESVAAICGIPVCNISLVNEKDIVIIASTAGTRYQPLSRENSFSKLTLKKGDFLEIPDTRQDPHIKHRIPRYDGFDVHYYAGHPLIDPDGNILGCLNIYDSRPNLLNPEQKKLLKFAAERIIQLIVSRRIQQNLQEFEKMFMVSKDLVGLADSEGKFVRINPAFSVVLGWSEEEIRSRSILHFVHPDDYPRAWKTIKEIGRGIPIVNFTCRFVTEEAQVIWIEWTVQAEKDTGMFYAIGHDITEIYKQNRLIEKSEKRFRGFFENSQGLMCIHDADGNILSINKNGAEMLGFTIEEALLTNIYDLTSQGRESVVRNYFSHVLEHGHSSGQLKVRRKDGKELILLLTNVLEQDEKGDQYILVNAIDLTERLQMVEELTEAKALAEKANQAKSEFLANMSHEIRTPLNGIIGFTDLIQKTRLDETQKQYINIIHQSGKTLLSIINDILDFSKIEAGKLTLDVERVNLKELLAEVSDIVSYPLEDKELELNLKLEEELPTFIWADEMRLKQVLINLLNNAVKFTEKGTVTLRVKILKSYAKDLKLFRFEVQDTGIGIRKEKQQAIFEAFAQEDGSISKKYGGTGLGLTISNRILKLGNSALQLHSEPGKGSCFFFDLKLKTSNDRNEKPKTTRSDYGHSAQPLKKVYRILIAEDNKINLLLARTLINQISPDATVCEATDGREAVRLYLKERPDLILMDIQMPNMNGLEATREIRSHETDERIPILALTAGNMKGEKERCLEAGMDDFLAKPILKQNLEMVLSKWLPLNESNVVAEEEKATAVEHINRAWFDEYTTHDASFKENFLILIRSGLRESSRDLRDHVLHRNLEGLKASGHKLKGTSVTAGLTELSKLAVAFERIEDFEDLYIQELLHKTLNEIDVVLKLLDKEG